MTVIDWISLICAIAALLLAVMNWRRIEMQDAEFEIVCDEIAELKKAIHKVRQAVPDMFADGDDE